MTNEQYPQQPGPQTGPEGQQWPGYWPQPPQSPQSAPQSALQPPTQPSSQSTGTPRRRWTAVGASAAVIVAAGIGALAGHIWWPAPATMASGPVAAHSHAQPPSSSDGTANGDTGNNSNHAGSDSPNNDQQQEGSGNGGPADGNGHSGGQRGRAIRPPFLLPGGLGGLGLTPQGQQGQGAQSGSVSAAPGAPANITSTIATVEPGLVDINAGFTYQHAAGAGTGMVLTSDGEVLTNNHVIDGATSISVTDLGNHETYSATVVGYDPSADVAVLQLAGAAGLTTVNTGDSATVGDGDAVIGIGNAGGTGGTPSAAGGKVTGLDQSISVGDEMYGTTEHLTGLIETNADIQPGDSGGPLVTSDGTVIGMDTAASAGLAATSSGHDGYAIPIDAALTIANTIESGDGSDSIHVGPTAALGVLVSSGRSANGNGSGTTPPGATVAGVIADGAGAAAGLSVGDVITSLDGHAISSAQDLTSLMIDYHPGQSVTLGWIGPDASTHQHGVILGTGPAA